MWVLHAFFAAGELTLDVMSALGQKRTIAAPFDFVRFVPLADIAARMRNRGTGLGSLGDHINPMRPISTRCGVTWVHNDRITFDDDVVLAPIRRAIAAAPSR
jgi:hypothetical protein